MPVYPLPFHARPEQYEQQAGELAAAIETGDKDALLFIHDYHPHYCGKGEGELQKITFTEDDARLSLLRFYHFHSWQELTDWATEAAQPGSPAAQFEAAAEAIVKGDTDTLETLLRQSPSLIRMRSARVHHSMLLHYAAANGVENYRQQTPVNIAEVVELLVNAGADINAEAAMYGGGSTVLGLAATSVWPVRAGVMVPLLTALLEAGAAIDAPGSAGNGQYIVNGCLHNGRPEAAVFLAQQGAGLDLEGAAGTGRTDKVKTFFNDDGSLRPGTTRQQMEFGFLWACAYGHLEVVDFMLGKGMDPGMQVDGMYGLHWALIGGHTGIVRLLIGRGASLEARNVYGGTALGAALWAVANTEGNIDFIPSIELLLQAGAVIEPGTLEWIEQEEKIRPEMKRRLEELFGNYL